MPTNIILTNSNGECCHDGDCSSSPHAAAKLLLDRAGVKPFSWGGYDFPQIEQVKIGPKRALIIYWMGNSNLGTYFRKWEWDAAMAEVAKLEG